MTFSRRAFAVADMTCPPGPFRFCVRPGDLWRRPAVLPWAVHPFALRGSSCQDLFANVACAVRHIRARVYPLRHTENGRRFAERWLRPRNSHTRCRTHVTLPGVGALFNFGTAAMDLQLIHYHRGSN